jgi:hypothetical protein
MGKDLVSPRPLGTRPKCQAPAGDMFDTHEQPLHHVSALMNLHFSRSKHLQILTPPPAEPAKISKEALPASRVACSPAPVHHCGNP